MREHQQSAILTICKLTSGKDLGTIGLANFSRLWDIKKNIDADKQNHLPSDLLPILSYPPYLQ